MLKNPNNAFRLPKADFRSAKLRAPLRSGTRIGAMILIEDSAQGTSIGNPPPRRSSESALTSMPQIVYIVPHLLSDRAMLAVVSHHQPLPAQRNCF
jgi:hypothetical protein